PRGAQHRRLHAGAALLHRLGAELDEPAPAREPGGAGQDRRARAELPARERTGREPAPVLRGVRRAPRRSHVPARLGAGAHLVAMTTAVPRTLSHYRLIERIGQGASGEVWLAEDTDLPRRVAIKLLHPVLEADAERVERLLREARATARIDHPNVVTVYEAGTD